MSSPTPDTPPAQRPTRKSRSDDKSALYRDITKLTHKYGLQEVREVVEARYQSMMRDVRAFVAELHDA